MQETEDINPASKGIDAISVRDVLELMHNEDIAAVTAVGKAVGEIEKAVGCAVSCIANGGRVYYIGAGTSGRLGVLDASEIYPTFGRDCFSAIMAGGEKAVTKAVEGAEDDEGEGRKAAEVLKAGDMAIGISASGSTPFVMAAIEKAREHGANCWLITCNKLKPSVLLDGVIVLATGPELLSGSTRLKAATATKLALNMISTATMIRLGGVYDGLMVDVVPSNKKLIQRAESMIRRITGCDEKEASELLRKSGMRPKVASLMKLKGVSKNEAEEMLRELGDSLRQALKS